MKYILLFSLVLLSLLATGVIGLTMTNNHDYHIFNGGHGMMDGCDDIHDEMEDRCDEHNEEHCEETTFDECEGIHEDREEHMNDACEHQDDEY